MLASAIPTKFSIPFANGAGGGYIRTIPTASQIGITNGAASLTDGFPPVTFLPVGAGGTPPFGQDFNGLLNQISAWNQWQGAGGPVKYDATFSAAIGGYPAGATIQSAVTFALVWVSLVDNNTSNPDTGGANWASFNITNLTNVRTILTANANYYVNASTGNDTTGTGSIGAPWQTLQKAGNYIQANIDGGGHTVTVNCTGAFTAGLAMSAAFVGCAPIFSFTSGSTVSATNSSCFFCNAPGAAFSVTTASGTNVVLTATGVGVVQGAGILAGAGGIINFNNVNFGACAQYHIIGNDGNATCTGSYTISGAAPTHIQGSNQGSVNFTVAGTTVTLTGTPAFSSSFATCTAAGLISCYGTTVTFSGSATGKRYNALDVSYINTAAAGSTFFPGNVAGTAQNTWNYN